MTAGKLSLSGVEVRRSGRTILHIDQLRVEPGRFVGIVGTNGAGKTTLLNVCCGLVRPDRGAVRLDDVELSRLGPWSKANIRKHIGYVPQSAQYNREIPYTLREVVTMGRTSLRGLCRPLRRQDHEAAERWIVRLGLQDRQSQVFGSLSGGEQQKALIARAMVQDPQMLLLDEPCANLDFSWKRRITDIIAQLYSEMKMTVLMVSHETGVLPAECERVLLVHEGRILADGPMRSVFADEAFERVYGCQMELYEAAGRLHTVSVGPSETL
ncbi:MAG TPA: metal ABC transporter ATP-binding protein [Phycisphaerales bacterium]|nr:metal ABC transporter ATP-binding protein [Phycisphaerales bacterium]